MSYKSFLVTGMGRSGTAFLAVAMDKSEQWFVSHEGKHFGGGNGDLKRPVAEIQKRFNKDYYGEVNGWAIKVAAELNLWRLGVLFRDPVEVFLSRVRNHHTQQRWLRVLDGMGGGLSESIRLAKREDCRVISFHKMVSDPAYLTEVFRHFGIVDVEATDEMVRRKVNAAASKPVLEHFGRGIRNKLMDLREQVQKYL